MYVIDTTKKNIEEVVQEVEKVFNGDKTNYIPCIDKLTPEDFQKLELIIEGESKIIKRYNHRLHILKYKPTIYSHKKQRAGVIEGSDKERMVMTNCILDLLNREIIDHIDWYVGENYILAEAIDNSKDVPPIEVIVKKCCVGTDKYRYYKIDEKINRFGKNVVNGKDKEYNKFIVRFDYRNPNHNPETGEPIGDYCLCDDLADEFINVSQAKKNALKTFNILDKHFKNLNIYFVDVCLMFTTQGNKLYGEISQDCGRYKYIEEDKLSDLDKDIWRAGGSSDVVLLKYKKLSEMFEKYLESIYQKEEKMRNSKNEKK